MEYNKCLVELDEILNFLSYEELNKIPEDIRKAIKENKDANYIWKYDETKTLKEQNINRKTIAMLSYINMEYLLNEEQRKIMEQIHLLNEKKLEQEKIKKYNKDMLFSAKQPSHKNHLIDVKKEKWYKRVFIFIKKLLTK